MDNLKKFLDNIEVWVIYVLFTVLLMLMFGQVIARYVFSMAFGWAEQMSRLLFVFITFAGMSYAAKHSAHLKVSFLAEFLPGEKTGDIIYLIGEAICAGVVIYISWLVFNLTLKVGAEGQTFSAAPFCPVWVMYAGGCIGLLGMGLRTLQYGVIHRIKEIMKKDDEDVSISKE